MTTTPPTVQSAIAPGAAPAGAPVRDASAARQFEGLFVRQLLTALRKTVPEGGMLGGGGGDASRSVVFGMIDDALASALSEGGGIGLAEALEASFSGSPTLGTTHSSLPAGPIPLGPRVTISPLAPNGPDGEQLRGATGLLQNAASPMVSDDAARRWSRDGTLGPQDLASPIETPLESGGVARFNVRDALGYQGYYKCNLFAFELARRAGFQVPVVGRSRGYGYMGADTVARDAGDGAVRGQWARVATGESAESLDGGIARGQRAFILAASSPGERPGHMAVVERVRSVEYGTQGEVRRIVFDGWEAKPSGARHLVQRTWNVIGNEGGTQPHNGFDLIQILELRHAGAGGTPEIPMGRPGRSDHDLSSSSSRPHRPNTDLEDSQ
jgi:Rod binding domain-containing protein